MSGDRPFEEVRHRYAQARDYYVLVFVMILLVILITSVSEGPGVGGVAGTAVLALALVLTLHTSGIRGRRLNRMRLLAILPVLAVSAALLVQRSVGPAYYVSMILLVLGTQASIVAHEVKKRTVTFDTVVGALCIYLLLGLLFAILDMFYGSGGAPFFAESGDHPAVDYMYFSFITLTTVGYGDLTPGTPIARVLALSEALFGQLYLVTVISLLVGNLGAQRLQRLREDAEDG